MVGVALLCFVLGWVVGVLSGPYLPRRKQVVVPEDRNAGLARYQEHKALNG